jgi:two-component system, response regulator YesN
MRFLRFTICCGGLVKLILNNKNLFVSKTFTKMILSYLVIVFITITMVSSIIYFEFSNATIQDIQINIQEKLKQNMNQLNFMRNQVNAIGLQLLDDNYIVNLIYRGNSNLSINYLAQIKLRRVVDANPMISSIYAYNGITKKYVSNIGASGSGTSLDKAMELEVNKYVDNNKMRFMPVTFINKSSYGNVNNEKIISVIFNDDPNLKFIKSNENLNVSNSMLIINLKAEYFQKFLTSSSDLKNAETFIINKEGQVICNSDLQDFGKNISNYEYIQNILNSDKSQGYLIRKDSEGQFLITFVASDSSSYIFINKTNYNALLQRSHALRSTILLFCLLILLLCVVISILAAYNVYLPFYKLINNIKGQMTPIIERKLENNSYNDIEDLKNIFSNIIDKTNELESSMLYNAPFIKKVFLKLLLEGDTAASSNVSKKTSEIKLNIRDSTSTVILFSIDGYSELAKLQDKLAESLLVTQIENIVDNIISDDVEMEIIYMEQDLITVIANIKDQDNFKELIRTKISLVQEAVFNEYGITITAVIGLTVDNIDKLYKSYNNCLELLKYRFVYGYKSILDNDIINVTISKKATYIDSFKKKIIKNIKECNDKELESEIDEIFTIISDNQYDYIKLAINQLALDIIKEVSVIITPEHNDDDFNKIYSSINDFQTMGAVKDWLIVYCKNIAYKLENKKFTRQRDTINLVVSYIEANYFKPEISSESVSEIVNLTPGYLGKLFSESNSKSINEYINELRMKRAKEELETSTASVNDVAIKVGFSNQSYFTAIFKKHFGVTPNQYRLDYTKPNKLNNNHKI